MSGSTWDVIDKRRQAKIKMSRMHNTHKRKEGEKEHASLDKEVKKLIQRDHRRYMDSIASEAQSAAGLGNIKGDLDSMKQLTNACQVSTLPVRTKDGECVTTSEGQLQRWREFFKEILTSDCPPYEDEEEEVTHSDPQLQVSLRTPSEREVIYTKVNEEQESCRFG
jgi:hypothetical protein